MFERICPAVKNVETRATGDPSVRYSELLAVTGSVTLYGWHVLCHTCATCLVVQWQCN